MPTRVPLRVSSALPPAMHPPPLQRTPQRGYWAAQFLGWGLYVGLGVFWNHLNDRGSVHPVGLALVYFTGLGASHLLRRIVLVRGWLDRPTGQLLPLMAMLAAALGVSAYAVEWALHVLLVSGGSLPPTSTIDVVNGTINWVLLLSLWAAGYFAWTIVVRQRREEIRILRLEAANRDNQLGNLRAQMNPHFMFNALNGIRALIDEDPAQAKRAITHLSAILRNAMATVKRVTVPLGEEIDIVKAYLALEAMRYEERLRTRFDMEPGLERVPCPPMLLQTLVENAVRHGIAHLPAGGDLVVSAHRGPEGLLLTVRNTGQLRQGLSPGGHGIGLRNTRRRLELIYGGKARFTIRQEGEHVLSEVLLPLDGPSTTVATIKASAATRDP